MSIFWGFLCAIGTMLFFTWIMILTGWDLRFFSGWMSCLTYISVEKYISDKEKKEKL